MANGGRVTQHSYSCSVTLFSAHSQPSVSHRSSASEPHHTSRCSGQSFLFPFPRSRLTLSRPPPVTLPLCALLPQTTSSMSSEVGLGASVSMRARMLPRRSAASGWEVCMEFTSTHGWRRWVVWSSSHLLRTMRLLATRWNSSSKSTASEAAPQSLLTEDRFRKLLGLMHIAADPRIRAWPTTMTPLPNPPSLLCLSSRTLMCTI